MSRRNRKQKRRVKSLLWMTVLTGMLSIFSTYAWFSTNKKVLLSNIQAKVSAAEGLQISLDGETWLSSIDFTDGKDTFASSNYISSAVLAANTAEGVVNIAGYNNVNWPRELTPASTGGTSTTTDLSFLAGEVSAEGDKLDNVGDGKANVISFDLYFKNSSSMDYDYLLLNNTSSIAPGAPDTGLEGSVRVGVLLYSTTANVTAIGSTVRALGTSASRVSIWEPFYKRHIQEIVNNDARITGVSQEYTTLGLINDPGADGIINVGTVTAGTNDNFLQAQNTVKTELGVPPAALYLAKSTEASPGDATVYDPGPGAGHHVEEDLTDATSATTKFLWLKGNSITKARVYIWLEGQDPDCIDTASTGQSLSIAIGFTKPSATPAAAAP